MNHRARYTGNRPRNRRARFAIVEHDDPIEAEWVDEPVDDDVPGWVEDCMPRGDDAA